MASTTALVPFQGLFPSRASIDGLWGNLDHNHDRSREEVVVRVYKPDDFDGIYGPDGEEIVRLNIGGYVDIYV